MRNYYRVMLGKGSAHAEACFGEGFIGTDYEIDEDLSGQFHDRWQDFNREFIPKFQKVHPQKTKIGAGLAMAALWTVSRGILVGDIVLCPDGRGSCRVCEVTGDYFYRGGAILQHRRPVRWLDRTIQKSEMSAELRASTFTQGTVVDLNKHRAEIELLLGGAGPVQPPIPGAGEAGIEDTAEFVMEKHLEDFLVENWAQTELGREYEVYSEDGERVGKQYPTDTGPIDILAISKSKKRLLVVELKRGRASDVAVGQILRYMGFVQDELAEEGQDVRGVIIASEEDPKLRRALSVTPAIEFYKYQVSFRLQKA
ncbi:MAG TPA: endonuclease NucS domain-containing protein [Phycisphaerales bacterium]|nr:endonuclease NucS domain-containing protein [Phycisphaerales bacterium]